jgi:anti-sigma factor RsiW
MECIAPDEITDEQLIAYIDGEADSATREHVCRCPYCAKRAHDYDLDQQALRALLYRADCPDAQTLGEYYLGVGLLSPADRAVIEAHLQECSLCAGDLAKLKRFLEEENMETITPQLIAAIIGGMYLSKEPRWVSPSGKEQARAIWQGLNLFYRGIDYKTFLIEKYVEGASFEEIASRRGHNRDWARSRVARALRLARGRLVPYMKGLRTTIELEQKEDTHEVS